MPQSDRHGEFAASGFFLLRTPLLPFDELLNWGAGAEAPFAINDLSRLEQAVTNDRIRLRARLSSALERPEVREALYVASPDLDESFSVWKEKPESKRGQRIEAALVRYYMRMAGKATPFGLFAGCSVGEIKLHTNLVLESREEYQRSTRLDMDYLCALVEVLERNPVFRNSLIYRVNSSLYRAGGRVRYLESRTQGDVRSYHLVAVENTDYLELALSLSERGDHPPELAAKLAAADSEFSADEAEEFIGELIESQLLISELIPAITGADPTSDLITQCESSSETSSIAATLKRVQTALKQLDSKGLGHSPATYRALSDSLGSLPVEFNLRHLFQVDMVKPSPHATLGHGVVKEIVKAVEILHRLALPLRQDPLARFQDAFLERYGEGREVPLLEVLDADVGIGLEAANDSVDDNSPLLRDLAFPFVNDPEMRNWGKRELYLLRKLEDVIRRRAQELVLEPDDLQELENKNRLPIPDAFSLIATIAAASENALSQGNYRVVVSDLNGPPGARLFGRFCHLDETLSRAVDAHLRAEERLAAGAVFAEIVHLPAGRTGNILQRPILREYEIPYLGHSGANRDRQIPVTDLTVTIVDRRLVLRSSKLKCEVIPRLTAAHYYLTGGLDVYRFLCLLQRQQVSMEIDWSWGALADASFLPRVSIGRAVLARAQWNFDKKKLDRLFKQGTVERFRSVQEWRAACRLPRFIALAEDDNELPVDLDNVLSVEAFLDASKGLETIKITEMFPTSDDLAVHGPEGRFVHQIVIPFVCTLETPQRKSSGHIKAADGFPRSFPPGSEWLYVKLYAGSSNADYLLRDVVGPVVDEALATGDVDSWFFLRYADPQWHLRLRLHGSPENLRNVTLPKINQAVAPFLSDGRLWRLQFDTYEREVERYGGPAGIVLAEKIFHADSMAVLRIIEAFRGNAGLDARWRLALRGIDMLLSDFGLDLAAKSALIESMLAGFMQQLQPDVTFKRELGARYRRERAPIEQLLDPVNDSQTELATGISALRWRSEQLAPLVTELKSSAEGGSLWQPAIDLLPSLTHMHVNRVLRSAHKAYEFILYDFLARFYESQEARKKMIKPESY